MGHGVGSTEGARQKCITVLCCYTVVAVHRQDQPQSLSVSCKGDARTGVFRESSRHGLGLQDFAVVVGWAQESSTVQE